VLWRLCNRLHSRQTRLTVSLLTPRAMNDYIAHYHTERNQQGKNSRCSIGSAKQTRTGRCDVATGWADFCGTIIKRQRELAVGLWRYRRGPVHGWRLQ